MTNIHLIAKIVDDAVVAPGATFSLNERVGERTAAKGFVPAPAIVAGEIEDQLGGGVSQFSTTLFNAAWFAGRPILTGARNPVAADGGFRIRAVRTVYDHDRRTGTATLRWTYDGLD